MTRFRNNPGQLWTITDEKQMELKEIPEVWLKNKNLSTQNKKMWTPHDEPSLPFIFALLWPAALPELQYLQQQLKLISCSLIVRGVGRSAGRGVWVGKETAKRKQQNKTPNICD